VTAEWLPGIFTILIVLVAMPLNWYVTFILWRASRADPKGEALRVTAVLALCVAIIVTIFAIIFVNNSLGAPFLITYETQIVTRGSLLLLSTVPALYWLRWYRRNGNGKP
jgi:hypothetical protein